MDIASATAASPIGEAAQARKSLAGNFDTFLTLLTTQLRNQDPLDPLDSNEFTQQLVQFTSVEQQIATNENLEGILAAMQVDQTSAAISLIGKQLDAFTDTTGLVDGQATWTYDLEGDAKRAVLTVADASGKIVYVGDGERTAGKHEFTWDGLDNAGNPLPDGAYKLAVGAVDDNNGTVAAEIGIRGIATGVVAGPNGETAVLVAGQEVPLSLVSRATLPPTASGQDNESESTAGDLLSRLADLL